jgi:hypothetical protein
VLVAHRRLDALCLLMQYGVDLDQHRRAGDTMWHNEGLEQIFSDNTFFYFALQQALLHGWSLAPCQSMCVPESQRALRALRLDLGCDAWRTVQFGLGLYRAQR